MSEYIATMMEQITKIKQDWKPDFIFSKSIFCFWSVNIRQDWD